MNDEVKPTENGKINTLCITYPLWGTAIVVALGCFIERYKLGRLGDLVLIIGVVGFLVSGFMLATRNNTNIFGQLIAAFVYYCAGSIVIFIFGWMALCWFCPSCN